MLNMADSTLPLFQDINLNLQTNYQNRNYVLQRFSYFKSSATLRRWLMSTDGKC